MPVKYFRLEKYAIEQAQEDGSYYGLSVMRNASDPFNRFDAWYVGTQAELVEAGVPRYDIKAGDPSMHVQEWLKNSLEHRRDETLEAERRARSAYTTGPLSVAADVLADAHRDAAAVYTDALNKLVVTNGPEKNSEEETSAG